MPSARCSAPAARPPAPGAADPAGRRTVFAAANPLPFSHTPRNQTYDLLLLSAVFWGKQKSTTSGDGVVESSNRGALCVPLPLQALASPGGETALDDTLVSISPVQTLSWCLHHFAAAVRIPAVALPTGRDSINKYTVKQNAVPVNPGPVQNMKKGSKISPNVWLVDRTDVWYNI